jgi:hypothetical protein
MYKQLLRGVAARRKQLHSCLLPMLSSRKAYSGSRRKIVLAFDVGTTYSGISYRQGLPFHRHGLIDLIGF